MFKKVIWLPYIFFAGFLLVGLIWVWVYIPETKGKTLEEMDRVFDSHTGEDDAMLLAEAQRDVGLTAYLDGTVGSEVMSYNKGTDTNISMVEHSWSQPRYVS